MLRWLAGDRPLPKAPTDLPSLSQDDIGHLIGDPNGLPRVDWHAASIWMRREMIHPSRQASYRRSIAAACLDELRDTLDADHRRWRTLHVEGLAPLGGQIGPSVAQVAERAFTVLAKEFATIRGDEPIAPVAVVLIEPLESYIDFTASYFPEDGAFATSGGLYLNEDPDAFALIAVNTSARHQAEAAVVHELTHHALHGHGLPLWVEEGFTQVMEQRVTGAGNFSIDSAMIGRQREAWSDGGIARYLDGESFVSPERDEQELAYHLSQWFVRSMLMNRPRPFMAFARDCKSTTPDDASERHLGAPLRDVLRQVTGIDD